MDVYKKLYATFQYICEVCFFYEFQWMWKCIMGVSMTSMFSINIWLISGRLCGKILCVNVWIWWVCVCECVCVCVFYFQRTGGNFQKMLWSVCFRVWVWDLSSIKPLYVTSRHPPQLPSTIPSWGANWQISGRHFSAIRCPLLTSTAFHVASESSISVMVSGYNCSWRSVYSVSRSSSKCGLCKNTGKAVRVLLQPELMYIGPETAILSAFVWGNNSTLQFFFLNTARRHIWNDRSTNPSWMLPTFVYLFVCI